jgi:hypothetical protein
MEMHPDKAMHMPHSSQIENGSWAGKAFYKNLKFIDFVAGVDATGNVLKN